MRRHREIVTASERIAAIATGPKSCSCLAIVSKKKLIAEPPPCLLRSLPWSNRQRKRSCRFRIHETTYQPDDAGQKQQWKVSSRTCLCGSRVRNFSYGSRQHPNAGLEHSLPFAKAYGRPRRRNPAAYTQLGGISVLSQLAENSAWTGPK